MDGNIEITKSNSYFYTDSLSNDMVIYTGTSNQHMLFGNQSNATSHINVWFSNITFNRLANFSCNVTIGTNPTTGLSNYVTLQTNNDFALIGNSASWPLDHGGPALYMRYSENNTSNSSFIQSINRLAGTSNMLDMQIQASNLYIATGGNTANINVTFKPDGKVGIGISNPSEILHIIGNTRQTGLIALNSNQPIIFGSNMVIGNAARIGFNLTGNSNFLDIFGGATSTSTGRQIYFWIDSNQSSGVSGMATFGGGKVFLNTGSLGIGTSNPLSRFHINSNALCYTLYTNNVNSNGSGGIIMGLEDGAGGAQIWNSSNGGYIKFGTSNTERLKIDINGFIGIGVSNPVNLLHIHNVTSTTSNVIQMTNVGTGSNIGNGFQLGQDQTGNIYLWNKQTAFMQFATTNIERMRITSTGALGIGITSPLTLIHMTSNTSNYITMTNTANTTGVMFGIEESATGGGAVIWQNSNAHIKFGTNNVERIRMTSNGYMGIGTTIPASRLTITGYDGTNDPMQYGLLQLMQNATGAVAGFHSNIASISIIRTGNQVAGMGYSKAQNIFGFGIGTNSNSDFYPSNLSMNLATGCIGINNLNPTSTIHALSNTYSFQFPANQANCSLSLYNSAGSPGAILFGTANTLNNCATIQFGYTAAGNNSNYIGIGNFGSDNTLVVTAATNVGIGTTSPVYKLDVNGSVNINKANTTNNKLLVLYDNSSSDSLTTACNFYGFGVNGSTLRYQVPPGQQQIFYSGMSNVIVLGATGWTNIGIGTSTPTFTTDIWQQNSNTKMLRLTGDCYKNISTYDPTNDDFSQFSISSCNNVTAGAYKVIMRMGVTTSNNYGFIQMVNPSIGNPQLCLQPQTGNVGINTSNPAYALDVAGGIRASNEIISNGAFSANHFRAILGNYGAFIRNDGGAFYLLNTNSGDQYGSYSNNRPFYFAFGSGTVSIAAGAITALDTCAGPPSAGFVGINISSPQEQLHINGKIKTSGSITTTNGHIIATPSDMVFNNGANGAYYFRKIVGSNVNSYTDLVTISGCNLCVRGTIYGVNGTNNNSWAMNLIDGGQAYKSIIVGSNNSTNNAYEIGFNNVGNGNSANRINFGFYGNTTLMNILANGNLGIGTIAPSYKLHVEGTGYFNGQLNISGNNSLVFNTWGGGWYMSDTTWLRATNDKQIYTGGTIATNNRLGIGTSGPDRRLQIVDGGSGDWVARYTNGSVNTYFCHSFGYGMNINSATTNNYAIQCYNGTQNHFTLYNNGKMDLQGPLYIYNQGGDANLGISLFQNGQDGASYTNYQGGIESWNGIGFRCRTDGITRHIFDARSGNYSMTGTLTTAAIISYGIIKADGNGTNGSCQLNRGDGGNFCGYVSFINASGTCVGYIGYQGPTANYLTLETENGFAGYEVTGNLIVDGNIGLGTGSPAYKLDVQGNTRVTGVSVIGTDYSSGLLRVGGTYGTGIYIQVTKGGINSWANSAAYDGTRYINCTGNAENTKDFNVGPGGVGIGYSPPTYSRGGVDGLYVNGRVGLGTNTPNSVLHVIGSDILVNPTTTGSVGGSTQITLSTSGTGDGSPNAIQVGMLGSGSFSGNVAHITTTAGGYGGSCDLVFRTTYNPTLPAYPSPTERMRITGSGNVGIGTSSPGAALHVAPQPTFTSSGLVNVTGVFVKYQNNGATGQFSGSLINTVSASIYSEGRVIIGSSEVIVYSDERTKENIKKYIESDAIEIIKKIPCKNFNYKDAFIKGTTTKLGFIAQDVITYFPEAVKKEKGYLCNICKLVTIKNNNIICENHELIIGDKVKLYKDDFNNFDIEVKEIISTDIFSVDITEIDKIKDVKLLYGKYVEDLLTIDHNQLFTLSFSAVRGLITEVNDLKKENQALKDMLSNILSRLDNANI